MLFRFFGYIFSTLAILFVIGAASVAGAVWWYGQDLPKDFTNLTDYRPPETSVVYNDDGQVIARFAKEQRAVIEIENVPQLVKDAFISAEDKNFYSHRGIDPVGIAKAMVRNIDSLRNGGRMSGASTITQQVVKNMLLTNERSIARKVKEAVLSVRIESELTKDEILEIYLNEIYLGARAYGIGAAARNYFGKDIRYLAPEEAAYLAALPKAPSALHPIRNKDAAIARRNYVLNEMVDNGYLDEAVAEKAKKAPLVTRQTKEERVEDTYEWASAYMIEEVRTQMLDALKREAEANGIEKPEGIADKRLYGDGLQIRTTLDAEMQEYAADSLREGLHRYERSKGYRGPLDNIDTEGDWRKRLAKMHFMRDLQSWKLGVVLDLEDDTAIVGLELEDRKVPVLLENVLWARRRAPNGLGPEIEKISQVFRRGDVVYVTQLDPPEELPEDYKPEWGLRQLPTANGAVIAMEPQTGRVLAMQGGISAQQSVFNRVTQAKRQVGSAFKPFIYATALDNGFTPADIVLDAPIVVDPGPGQDLWIPENYNEGTFYGPIPMRQGLEKSINLITIRIAQTVGMHNVANLVRNLGVYEDEMPTYLSYSLGAGETTLARMAAAYSIFVNGGKKVVPAFVESITDRDGNPVALDGAQWLMTNQPRPEDREQVLDPVTAFQTVSLMEGVVLRGTATRLTLLGFPVAGKTGTTNEARDAWFVGFTPDLVFGCYVGYDTPKSLGKKASGGAICGPVFMRFMQKAMADRTPRKFDPPEGVELVKIDRNTGLRVPSEVFGKNVIWEAFRPGTAPLDYDGSTTMLESPSTYIPAPGNQQPYGSNQQPYASQPFNAPQPDPTQPMLQVDPYTGQIVVQQDPAIRAQPGQGAPLTAQPYRPQPLQPGQPQTPLVRAPQQPPGIAIGNSAQDIQGGRGLY